MATYQIVTLVDITRTNPTRSETDSVKLSQQSNFNSLIQAIGIRSNVEWKKDPVQDRGTLPWDIDGHATYWFWEFEVEREDVFRKGTDSVGLLLDDLDGVPVIDGLNNSVIIDPSVFITQGAQQNIWIKEV